MCTKTVRTFDDQQVHNIISLCNRGLLLSLTTVIRSDGAAIGPRWIACIRIMCARANIRAGDGRLRARRGRPFVHWRTCICIL